MNARKTILLICISFFLFNINGDAQFILRDTSFNYVSDTTQTWTVPGCVTQVTVQLWAGGGGGGHWYELWNGLASCSGGSGAYYKGVISGLTQGMVLTLYVPSGGEYKDTGVGGVGGWPGGGHGGWHTVYPVLALEDGGGGGYAAIEINRTYYVVVGAGGGGSSYVQIPPNPNGYGGSGGATTGGNGGIYPPYGGYGASISSGGLAGSSHYACDSGTSGSAFMGGNGAGEPTCGIEYGAGGGGAGYYGGGGGGDYGGGGGGGSSYPASTFTSGGITFTPIANLQGNSGLDTVNYLAPGSPPDSTIGMGGYFLNGGNGLIIISYIGGAPLTAAITSQIRPTCGICNGSLTVTASGGIGAYTYLWSPTGQTNATATGLCANTYTVLVSDSCGDTTSKAIELISVPLTIKDSAINTIKCNGECTGSAGCSVVLGTSPYTYSWSPSGGTNATATGLCAGTYTVTVKDKNGCTGTASVTITQPTKITPTITVTNAICNGGDGSASASVTGGYSPYTYLWTGGQTNSNATGLSPGTYTLTVTDKNGCTVTTTATITQPLPVTATLNISSPVLCNGGIGSITCIAGNGISPYTYLWTGGQTNVTATNLSAGNYTVTITDHNGCTASAGINLTQPTLLTATLGNVNNVPCYGGTGSASVNAAGGTSPYTYLWTGGQTNANAIGLSAGNYTVTVTDKNNCTATAVATVTQPSAALSTTVTISSNISCHNGDNGSATVNVTGGTSPYTYLWNPSANTNAIATNLFALNYTVTVTDAHNCTTTATVILTQPTAITASISEPKLICKDSTGILIVNASGGTPPYIYHWSTGTTGNVATVTPIFTNNYSVTVTDANGCTTTANIILRYGPNFSVDVSGKGFVCAGDSTTLCATAIGALDGAYYLWEPENNTNACITVEPSLSSVYTITVVDGCGSTTTATTEVNTVPSPDVKMTVNIDQGCYPLCVQFRNSTTISQGGIRQYNWTFGNGDTSQTQNPIYCYTSAGQYNVTLTATSDSGCSATLSKIAMISVYAHPDAAFTYSPQNVTVENPTIQFTDESSDASGIIYHKWSFGDETDSTSATTNPIHTYFDTGQFCPSLIVMDNHGCTDTTTNCLIISPAYKLYIPSAFTPNADGLNETFEAKGMYIKTFTMYIFDRWGQQIFHTSDITQGWNGKVNGTGAMSQEDTYIYKINVTDSEGNQHSYVGNVTLLK